MKMGGNEKTYGVQHITVERARILDSTGSNACSDKIVVLSWGVSVSPDGYNMYFTGLF